jgi:2-succinyl-5-enolpyruvyl-6-hydroxy-3-cyclohexene-1-carboxylate synthase
MINPIALSNTNSLWGWFAAQALCGLGVRQAVVSPGSRSTPLALGIAHNGGIEALPILDERSAAFYALGLARQSMRPVALVCTSGTAAANYLPAIVEAHESGIPLLVVTADRPPLLRRCCAGQAIDQIGMYGRHANDFLDLPLPEASARGLKNLRQNLSHAVYRTMRPFPGPVHLNCPFDEPLAPEAGKRLDLDFDPEVLLEGMQLPVVGELFEQATGPLFAGEQVRGLIVAGSVQAADDAKARRALFSLAERSGWPVIADVLGPWRAGEAPVGVVRVGRYVDILRTGDVRSLQPDCILQIGPLPTCKTLRQWFAALDLPTLVVGTGFENLDPAHARTRMLQCPPERMDSLELPSCASGYAAQWRRAEKEAAKPEMRPNDEGWVAKAVFESLCADASLFVASSMSVRHAERLASCGHAPFRVFFNRGANGIDGTLATALGCAHGGRGVLLTGDLALLHDAGSLLSAHQMRGSMSVVLVDNGGGGIFDHLPIARTGDAAFDRFFRTPQKVSFGDLASAYGASYEKVEGPEQLGTLLTSLPDEGLRILHCRV